MITERLSNCNASVLLQITYMKQNEQVLLLLDTIDDTNVNARSTLTTHPVPDGTEVADHIYKEPTTMSVTGTFTDYGSERRLPEIQRIFEEIKDNGYLCSIVKITNNSVDDIRFMRRNNMVLDSINWTESINSMRFSLNFTQALLVEVDEAVVDTSDEFLPNIYAPQSLNFTETLLDWSYVDAQVLSALSTAGLVTDIFLTYLKGSSATTLAVILGAGTAALVVASVSIAAIPYAAAIAVAIIGVYGILKTIHNIVQDTKYKIDVFDVYKDNRKTDAEVKRYGNLISSIHTKLNTLNDKIKVYKFDSNIDQELDVIINNNYYTFRVTKNSSSEHYALTILQYDTIISNIGDINTYAMEDFSQCINDNNLLKSQKDASYCYILCAGERDDLTNFYIVVSEIAPESFTSEMNTLIEDALTR